MEFFSLYDKGICYFLYAAVLSVLALQSWLKSKIYSKDSYVKRNLFFSHIGTSKIQKFPLNMLCCYWHNECDCWSLMSTLVDATRKFLKHFQFKKSFSTEAKAKHQKKFSSEDPWGGFSAPFAYENSWGISTIQFCIVMQCKSWAHTLPRLKICSHVALEVCKSFQFDFKFENISSILKQKV